MTAEVAAVILAAGRSTRMGATNKMLVPFRGEAMVRHPVRAALDAGLRPFVVIGHEADAVRAAMDDLPEIRFVESPDYQLGIGHSVAAGIAALPPSITAAFVMLGDMPLVGSDLLCTMVAHLGSAGGASVIVPRLADGRSGNPVLFARAHFPALEALSGDQGARSMIQSHPDAIACVETDDPGIVCDFDTPGSFNEK